MKNKLYYHSLDLSMVIDKILAYASFDLSYQYILDEMITFNPLYIIDQNALVREALETIEKHQRINLEDIKDISDIVERLRHKQILTTHDLISIFEHLVSIKRIKQVTLRYETLDRLRDYIDGLHTSDFLIDEINKVIDSNGKFRSTASDKYLNLNQELTQNNEILNEVIQKIMVKYEESLQDKVVSIRNDRLCLLIKNRDKNKIKGLFHGESQSKISSYIEPIEIIELNNQKQNILASIKEEELRILTNLSKLFFRECDKFTYNLDSLTKLDVFFAKADYGFHNNASIANFNSNNNLLLKNFAHPLIEAEKVVLNSYVLNNDINKIIISGSNTGGKTVCLKSIGLAVLMSYLAIPLICEHADIPLYDGVYHAIDDNQSIAQSLSTFSASLSKINEIINVVTKKSLVLIDELGNGTDPKEASALACAVVEHLADVGCNLVCTTHFSELKQLALSRKDFMLASVGFDLELLKPTYKYLEHNYGHSNSFKIAQKYLKVQTIVERCQEIYHAQKSQAELLIEELNHQKKLLEVKNIEIEKLKHKLNQELNALAIEKTQIIAENNEKYAKFVEEYQDKLDVLKQEINASNTLNKVKKLSKELDEIKADVNNSNQSDTNFDLGELVNFLGGSQVGKIVKIDGQKVVIDLNGKIINTNVKNITKTNQKIMPKPKTIRHEQAYKKVTKEINVIGLNTNEALDKVSEFIDHLALNNCIFGHIIHGVGQGILQKAIHNYLKNHRLVKEVKFSQPFNGGFGASDVYLK